MPLACPALRRLRLVACANCRGTLASDTQLPPPVASSDRRLSATSDGHFGEMTPVKGPDAESDDELFAMDDERPERNVSFASPTSRRLAFDEPPREPRRSPSPAREQRRSPSPARATPPRRPRGPSAGGGVGGRGAGGGGGPPGGGGPGGG